MRSRSRTILIGVFGAIAATALFVGGWLIATQFESPEQREARAKPPQSSVITVPVSRGNLDDVLNVSADVARASAQRIVIEASDGPAVVTKSDFKAGSALSSGAVVLELRGRPLFAFPGSFPFYRDLSPGDAGPDVAQLQRALIDAGFSLTADGSFGKGTENAVRALYKKAGYDPATKAAEAAPTSKSADASEAVTPVQLPAPVLVLPTSELVVFAVMPAFIARMPAVGALLGEEEALEVESGALVASAVISADAASVLTIGLLAQIEGTNGAAVPGVVESISDPDENADVTVRFAGTSEMPAEWLGTGVLITLTRSITAENAFLVPSRAVITGGDDSSHVLRQSEDGSFQKIPVHEAGVLDGTSAIEPVDPDNLAEGDLVRVR